MTNPVRRLLLAPEKDSRRRSAKGGRRIGLGFLLAFALVSVATPPGARAQSLFPERQGAIANDSTLSFSESRVQREYEERIGDAYGFDGLFLLVEECLPEPESYLDEALLHYGLAPEAGAIYDDAMVWMVCESPRFAGFFYASASEHGAAFDAAGVSDEVSLQMAEQLGAGNVTGALTRGIDAAARALAEAEAGRLGESVPAGAAPDADVPAPAPAGASRDGDGSSGSSGATRDLASQILGVGALGLGGLWIWRRRKREEERAAKAAEERSAADSARRGAPKAELAPRVDALSERLVAESNALARLVLAYESIGPEAMLEVSRAHDAMLARMEALKSELAEMPEIGPEVPGAIEREADSRLRARYAELERETAALEAYVTDLEHEADHVEMLEERAAVLAVEARKAIARASEAYAALVERIEPEAVSLPAAAVAMSVPAVLADQAEAELAEDDRITAGRLAEDAATLAAQVPKVLEEAIAVDDRIDEGVALFDRIEAYVETSWADIRGNGSEAEESLDAALDLYARVLAADHDAFGADVAAGFMDGIEKVAAELHRASSLIQAIGDRLQRLDAARSGSVETIDGLRDEIRKARAWLAQRDVESDVDETPGLTLDRAEALLEETVAATGEEKPDWLNVARNLQRVAQDIAKALAEGQRQNERVDALRKSWESAHRSAAAAVERVEQYQGIHRPDLGPMGIKRFEDARAALREAEGLARRAEGLQGGARAEAVDAALEACARAEDAAETAYEAMAADVARADERRGAYVPRPSWIGPTVPMPRARRRSIFFPDPFGGGFGSGAGPILRPQRPMRQGGWGARPRPNTRPVQPRRISRPSGGGSRGSSTRRGGGRGW